MLPKLKRPGGLRTAIHFTTSETIKTRSDGRFILLFDAKNVKRFLMMSHLGLYRLGLPYGINYLRPIRRLY